MKNLTVQAFLGLLNLVGILALMLFLPGWSFNYWQAWVFLFVFTISVFLITLYFLSKDPNLIQSRLRVGPAAEQQKNQKIIPALAGIFFILPFITFSIDHRLGWSRVPSGWFSWGGFGGTRTLYCVPGFSRKYVYRSDD